VLGDPFADGTTMGPLNNEGVAEKMDEHVADALERGAELVHGGERADGYPTRLYWQATVLDGVPADSRVATEETFGPVAPLIGFDAEDEAIAVANATEYGLAAYLFTRDLGRAHRVGEALDYGMVAINDGALGWVQAPFGGVKGSGDAREGGRLGLEDYLDVQYLSLNF
jgi:succinate-semialdehyde dehydrogenase/glutarate-semialdehyde dehydrogenase